MSFLTRRLLAQVPLPRFTVDRNIRRLNLQDADRFRLFYWNLISAVATTVPFTYLLMSKQRVCPESEDIIRALSSDEKPLPRYDLALFGNNTGI
eukprot:GHVR01027181.1.p1 GENE.GHVR01027181.1~~GHVR01027181.1.p1  ORF type:complete len:105 (+),score=7.60 GHVR01027181.1:36-317(+)